MPTCRWFLPGIVSVMLSLSACQTAQPIVLHPLPAPVHHVVAHHATVPATTAAHAPAQAVASCERRVPEVNQSEREAIFREFEGRQSSAGAMSASSHKGEGQFCRPAG